MNVVRNEIRTGLVVLFSMAVMVGLLLFLGAPGVLSPQKEFGIYFDNAAGLKQGTQVMLAGRKVGQVISIASPVPMSERPLGKDGKPQALEARVMVQVEKGAQIYDLCKVSLVNYGVLSEMVIDFTEGDESSGLAADNKRFVGIRQGGLADAGVQIMEKLDPALEQLNTTLKSLQKTADNLSKLTDNTAELPLAFAEIRKVAANLTEITGPTGSLPRAINSIDAMAAKDGEFNKAAADFRTLIASDSDLAKTLANAEKFTKQLAGNGDVPAALRNIRSASERLNGAIAEVRADFSRIADNLSQATDTLKKQPWRLIWPGTKKYPKEEAAPVPKIISKKKATPAPRRGR